MDNNVRALTLLLLALGVGCGPAPQDRAISITDALRVDTTGYARASPETPIVFPRDHGPHPEFYLEWWYLTGNLTDGNGRRFGYQFTIFRNALRPPQLAVGGWRTEPALVTDSGAPSRSAWRTDQLYSAHLAISDIDGNQFFSAERYARGAAGLAGAGLVGQDSRRLEVWVEDWRIDADGTLEQLHVTANNTQHGLDLVLRPQKPIVLQGKEGFSPKGTGDGQASHYYSITRLETDGTIRIGDEEHAVEGLSWFDREWSTSLLSPDQSGWDWFSLQLDDGRDLMFFRLRSEVEDFVDGKLIGKDGMRTYFDPSSVALEPTRTWTSPGSGVEYPVEWRLRVPDVGLDLVVEAAIPQQELDVRIRYWEGAMTVSGTGPDGPVSGRGYAELTGY